MKLSDFFNRGYSRKIIFKSGKYEVEDMSNLNGEINFIDIDRDVLIKVRNIVEKDSDNILIFYKMLPYICDIEVDIEFDKFTELIERADSQFVVFLEQIYIIFDKIVEGLQSIERLNDNIDNTNSKLNAVSKRNVEDITRELESLYSELVENVNNFDKKKEIINRINTLQEELKNI